MKSSSTRRLGGWLRDMAVGAVLFLVIPALASLMPDARPQWRFAVANAGEVIASGFVEPSAPVVSAAEDVALAATQLRQSADPLATGRLARTILLGLTFSFLVSFNLAIFRHLRRVSASPRRDGWRGRR